VAALFISFMILSDGVKNMRSAIQDLMDARAKTYDGAQPHPVIGEVENYLRGLDWVAEAGARARDEGHVFHVECFVVPRDGCEPSVTTIEQARTACADMDWRMLDVVVVPVPALPAEVAR
jgi:divalent metal cation (Fe/Co/Zn/Cd) transporter